MPWSNIAAAQSRAAVLGGYALALALAGAEISILALAVHPKVGPDYRAYYIDRTTTCLNRDAVGSYTIGETISFKREGHKQANNIKVCGWSGPAGDGTHSLGETSRLRVNVTRPSLGGLKATLEMSAVLRPPQTEQRVVVLVNGILAHKMVLSGKEPQQVSFVIPQAALAGAKTLEIAFDYLDGIPPTRSASNIYKRAIKLISFRLNETGEKLSPTDLISGP